MSNKILQKIQLNLVNIYDIIRQKLKNITSKQIFCKERRNGMKIRVIASTKVGYCMPKEEAILLYRPKASYFPRIISYFANDKGADKTLKALEAR